MNITRKILSAGAAAAVVVAAGAVTAFAGHSLVTPGSTQGLRADPAAAAVGCTKLQASDIAWVTLDKDGNVDKQVESYPSGTDTITPVFTYNCNPTKVPILLNIYFNDESVGQIKDTLAASRAKGFFGIPISYDDNSALDEGTWSVEYVTGKVVLTKGEVVVGEGDPAAAKGVTLFGTVSDKKTQRPIRGAVILVLKPGVTIALFVKHGQKAADVFALAKTDAKGQYTLLDPNGAQEQPLERNTAYSLIVAATGYKPLTGDGVKINDTAKNPLQADFQLVK